MPEEAAKAVPLLEQALAGVVSAFAGEITFNDQAGIQGDPMPLQSVPVALQAIRLDLQVGGSPDVGNPPVAQRNQVVDQNAEPVPPVDFDGWVIVRVKRALQGHEGELDLRQVLHPPVSHVDVIEDDAIHLSAMDPAFVGLPFSLAARRGSGYEQIEAVS